jgi:hypothetical protein
MLHLSTGIATRNEIHAAPERGSLNVTSWNGDANEDIRDRHSLDLRGCRCRCCGRSSGSSTAATTAPGTRAFGRQDAHRQGADRQMAGRQGACRLHASAAAPAAGSADHYQGLSHPAKNGSTALVRSFFRCLPGRRTTASCRFSMRPAANTHLAADAPLVTAFHCCGSRRLRRPGGTRAAGVIVFA